VIGICSHGTLEPYGVGHIVLQPVVYMALAMLAVGLPTLGAGLRVAAVAGCAVDLALGICLHFALESHVFRLIQLPNGHLDALLDNGLSPFAARNYLVKQALGIVFWGDHLAPLVPGLQILVLCLGTGMLVALARQLRLSGLRPGR